MTPYQYADVHAERFIAELIEFLQFPSISTLAEHQEDVQRTALWLVNHIRSLGVPQVRLISTARHPIVIAQWQGAGSEAPHVVFYGHYDVQPVDPLDSWISAPFVPRIVDGKIYARGATDDKGQVFAHLKAIESYLATQGKLPCNVTILIEGEEEIGSPSLPQFIADHRQLLHCDAVLISDTAMFSPDAPSLVYALRGLVYMELHVRGPLRDLHSGSYGGAVVNPANALARIVASLHEESGRIAVPGIYDDVLPLDDEEQQLLASLPFDHAAYEQELGIEAVGAEKGYSVLERIGARPTLDVNGMWSGFTGKGAKTVLPATAHAKISLRIVPNQRADRVAEIVAAHIERHVPRGVRLQIECMQGSDPVVIDRNSPPMRAAARALERVFGRAPVYWREGGSIPIVADFQRELAVPVVLMGFGLHSDGAHSPNEHFHMTNFNRGIAATIAFLEEFAAGQ